MILLLVEELVEAVENKEGVAATAGELNELWLNDPLRTWAISADVKKLACAGLSLIVNENVGTVLAPVKSKVIKNQY